jgi:energy-coupling factor transporter ATP-binding protein EcfA2
MRTSEEIKLELKNLHSAAGRIEGLLSKTRESAGVRYDKLKRDITEFFHDEDAEIQSTKEERTAMAQADFFRQYATLKSAIPAKGGLTYASWKDDPSWSAFDIEKERPAHNLTRLGFFGVNGQHETLRMPAMFPILGGKNILLRASGTGKQQARHMMRNIAFRLLASVPPGKLRLTFIDPVELGSTGAGLIDTLPDFLTGGLAWHDEQDIQDQLSLIETRVATIKTKYLGVNFSSIERFNTEKGAIEEPYWLVVVSDCPVRFRELALERLLSIASNGPPAGVFLAVMVDEQHKKCTDYLISELARTAHHLVCPDKKGGIFFDDPDFADLEFIPDPPPTIDLIRRITGQVNKTAPKAKNIKVDWKAPALEDWWKDDSRNGIKVPLGIFGAHKTQFFELDEKLLNSALIIGKPGSGKSRLLHVLINGLATRYSPTELELYLLDCKQVEFKDYAVHKLPHARVVAIESEREFGLSVLRRLNEELDARKTEFSAVGETSLSSYRSNTGKLMPRILLFIDEFQELLNADDPLARESAGILDRLVRQGRALGINIVLASQTLAGQTALQSSTKNQIPIRLVLQCSESDSIAILGQENDEARLLERPGEAIYNSANGRKEGNNRFQVAWLSDEALESLLGQITAHAKEQGYRRTEAQVIFDGNSIADIRHNESFKTILRDRTHFNPKRGAFAWLGDPIELKEPTAAHFKRQSRSNLAVLGQNEYEQVCVSMLTACMASIAIQQASAAAQFVVLSLADPDSSWAHLPEVFDASFPHQTELLKKDNFRAKLSSMAGEIEKRAAEPVGCNPPSIYLVIIGLHRERQLRRSEPTYRLSKPDPIAQASDADLLSRVCREGPACGVHCLIWCDTISSFNRVFQRNDIDEFSLRVAMQMPESDSRSFIDSDAANRLGANRAIFFDDERHGRLEKFRPYSLIREDWLRAVARELMLLA